MMSVLQPWPVPACLQGETRELLWEGDFMEAAMLPLQDWHFTSGSRTDGMFKRHTSCALVGNSGTLSGSKMGGEIDGHNALFRINYAPTKVSSFVAIKRASGGANKESVWAESASRAGNPWSSSSTEPP